MFSFGMFTRDTGAFFDDLCDDAVVDLGFLNTSVKDKSDNKSYQIECDINLNEFSLVKQFKDNTWIIKADDLDNVANKFEMKISHQNEKLSIEYKLEKSQREDSEKQIGRFFASNGKISGSFTREANLNLADLDVRIVNNKLVLTVANLTKQLENEGSVPKLK